MRVVSLVLAAALIASPAVAQARAPIGASVDRAVENAAQTSPRPSSAIAGDRKGARFWSGLAIGISGATTSALGLTVFRTENTSTGNAPDGTYLACVAQKNSSPIYATNQCDALKGKNLKLLWGGVVLGGVGAALMISGLNTSAELSSGAIGIYHRLRF
jgi:hypothetical protein